MALKKKLIRITTTAEMLTNQLSGQVDFMRKNGFDVLMISSAEEEHHKLLWNQTCPHIVVPMTRTITPWKDLKALFQLIKIITREKPDIVHTESPKAGLLGSLAAWICGVKIRIHTIAGLPLMVEKGFKLKLLEFVEKITYAAATNIWPNSPSLREYILKHKYTNSAKLSIIGQGSSNGLDVKKFNKNLLDPTILEEIKASINYDKNCTYLLYVGRMVHDKGIVELIEVFTDLQKSNDSLRLILLGYYERILDPLPKHIEHEIFENPSFKHFNWTDKVAYYMSLSNFFIFPSHREGFPNVLLEAAAMQLPILCTNIVGNTDIVSDGITGLIFEPNNTASLKNKMVQALQNIDNGKEMAVILQKRITSHYQRDIFWENLFNEYNKLLNASKKK